MNSRVNSIEGVQLKVAESSQDFRGSFTKFNLNGLFEDSVNSVALSSNQKQGTIRGLHFQTEPFAEEKLVSCIQGSIFDVLVDLRPTSKTFGKWTSFELTQQNQLQLFIPKGLAHGFQTLESNSIVHYCLSAKHSPKNSFSLNPFYNSSVNWPLSVTLISERDANGLSLALAAKEISNYLDTDSI